MGAFTIKGPTTHRLSAKKKTIYSQNTYIFWKTNFQKKKILLHNYVKIYIETFLQTYHFQIFLIILQVLLLFKTIWLQILKVVLDIFIY